jgi:hypothetical protein
MTHSEGFQQSPKSPWQRWNPSAPKGRDQQCNKTFHDVTPYVLNKRSELPRVPDSRQPKPSQRFPPAELPSTGEAYRAYCMPKSMESLGAGFVLFQSAVVARRS